MANREMIDRVLDAITEETFDMRQWAERTSCGTKMCFAGHAVAQAGYQIKWYPDRYPDPGVRWTASLTTDGDLIQDVAAAVLGLTPVQAATIFYSTGIQTVEELRTHIDNVLSGKTCEPIYECDDDDDDDDYDGWV